MSNMQCAQLVLRACFVCFRFECHLFGQAICFAEAFNKDRPDEQLIEFVDISQTVTRMAHSTRDSKVRWVVVSTMTNDQLPNWVLLYQSGHLKNMFPTKRAWGKLLAIGFLMLPSECEPDSFGRSFQRCCLQRSCGACHSTAGSWATKLQIGHVESAVLCESAPGNMLNKELPA